MATFTANRKSLRKQSGFSLVEMMCVLAIISIMASFAWPAIVGIVSGDRLSNNAYQLSNVVQQARSEAVARHTYVWVGFYSYKDANGVPAVMVASVCGNSGLSTDLQNNNFTVETKPTILRNVSLAASTAYTSLPGFDSSVTTTDVALYGYSFPFTLNVGGKTNVTFTDAVAFGPDGQANLAQASGSLLLEQCVGMGLQQAPVTSKLHVAAIQVRGLSGDVSVLQQ